MAQKSHGSTTCDQRRAVPKNEEFSRNLRRSDLHSTLKKSRVFLLMDSWILERVPEILDGRGMIFAARSACKHYDGYILGDLISQGFYYIG